MSLVSLGFLTFFAVCTLVYYLIPGKIRWIWLLLAGLVFYALASGGLILVPLIDALVAYLFGKLFETRKKRILMFLELVLIIGVLILFKYAGWFGSFWPQAVKDLSFLSPENLIVPLGISYYSIMAISYSVDVYRDTIRAEQSFAKLLLFLTFFPVVTQGPICRYEDTMRQLTEVHRFRYENLTFGIQRMIWGFFKKLVISERLTVLSLHLTEGWGESSYTGIWVLVSVVVFSFRLYMDFSGCIDIVLGAAEVLGIRLPENFNHSYLSRTIPEFWRRWHITLGTWLRDYVMYSFTMSEPAKRFTKKAKNVIGRKAAASIVTCVGILLVWFVYAVWHDISLVFLLSGGFFAFIIILSTLLDPVIRKFRKRFSGLVESLPYKIFMTIRTMLLSMMGAFFVFMPTVKDGAAYFFHIFTPPTGAVAEMTGEAASLMDLRILGLDIPDLAVLVLAFVLWIVVSRLHAGKDVRERMAGWRLTPRWIVLLAMVLAVVLFGKYGGLDGSSFVYQAF